METEEIISGERAVTDNMIWNGIIVTGSIVTHFGITFR